MRPPGASPSVQAAPQQPGAPPQPRDSAPWPPQPCCGRSKVEDSRLAPPPGPALAGSCASSPTCPYSDYVTDHAGTTSDCRAVLGLPTDAEITCHVSDGGAVTRDGMTYATTRASVDVSGDGGECESFPCDNQASYAECAAHPMYFTRTVYYVEITGALTTGSHAVSLSSPLAELADCTEGGYASTARDSHPCALGAYNYDFGLSVAACGSSCTDDPVTLFSGIV
eukprot:Transcript_21159.p2 GENE.Transcript_21159~~Transcript_21159.p2  ORF type:complete len:225 (-),score=40.78 Transcript_21159:94-768(-)